MTIANFTASSVRCRRTNQDLSKIEE
jgi:hypothetical protein